MQGWSDIYKGCFKLLEHKLRDCFHAATHELQGELDQQVLHTHLLDAHNAFADQYQSIFDQLTQPQDVAAQKKSITFSERNVNSLSVLTKQEHSFHVYGESFCSKAEDLSHSPLIISWLRFECILGHALSLDALPNSPQVLSASAKTYVSALFLDEEQAVKLYKAILKEYVYEFHELNTQLNNFFVSKSILTELDDNDVHEKLRQSHKAEKDKQQRHEVLSEMAEFVMPEALYSSSQVLDMESVLDAVEIPEQLERHLVDNDLSAELLTNEALVEHIEDSFAEGFEQYNDELSVDKNLAEELNQTFSQDNIQISKSAENTIAMLSMLFDDLEQFDLPEPIQLLIDKLSLPMLKTALKDQDFFLDTDNAGQKLLNKMAELSVLWESSDQDDEDILLAAMSLAVQKVNQYYDTNTEVFADSFYALEEAEAQYLSRAKKREARLKSLEKAKSRQVEAQQLAQQHLQEKFLPLGLSLEINAFLNEYWSKTLCFAFNKFANTNNELWQAALDAENLLLHYLRDKVAAKKRKAVIAMQEQLLSIGLAKIEVNGRLNALIPLIDAAELSSSFQVDEEEVYLDPEQRKIQESILQSLDSSIDDVETELEQAQELDDLEHHVSLISLPDSEATFSNPVYSSMGAPNNHEGAVETDASSLGSETIETGLNSSDDLKGFGQLSDVEEKNVSDKAVFDLDNVRQMLTMNTWVLDNRPSPELKLKLATYIKFTDTYIWVNRQGIKEMDMNSEEAVSLLNSKQLEIIENDAVFDRALEHVISSLRA